MLEEAGFEDIEMAGETGFNSSSVTSGVLFRATKPLIHEVPVPGENPMTSDSK